MIHIKLPFGLLVALCTLTIATTAFAQSAINFPSIDKPEIESESLPMFYTNEILIKFSKETVDQLKVKSATQTGNAELDTLFQKEEVVEFSQLVTPSNKSLVDSDIFRWFFIKTAAQPTLIHGEYLGSGSFETSDSVNEVSNLTRFYLDLEKIPGVEVVEPHYQSLPLFVPNDLLYSTSELIPNYGNLWWLHQIQPEQAWDRIIHLSQKPEVIIAVIDTGLDMLHPDIINQVYHNPNEIPANDIDDDQNGFIDDVNGWDFGNNDNNPNDNPLSSAGHGTMVAGIVGAQIDNDFSQVATQGTSLVGVGGFDNIKILPIKVYQSAGASGQCPDINSCALVYAADMGAKVANLSLALTGVGNDDLIKYAHDRGMVTVIAGGNTNRDISIDQRPSYGVIVSRSGFNDSVLTNTNWGEQIDVTAPGDWIISLKNSINTGGYYNYYALGAGTSYSAPQIAGLAGLLLTINPSLTNEQIRQIMRISADDIGTPGKDYSFGYGRINVSRAGELADQISQGVFSPLTPMIRTPRAYQAVFSSSIDVVGDVAYGQSSVPGDFSEFQLELGIGTTPSTWETIGQGSSPVQNGVLGQYNSHLLPEGLSTLRLTANSNTHSYQYTRYIKIDNLATSLYCTTPVNINSGAGCIGTSMSRDRVNIVFDHFRIEYRLANTNDEWETAGISLVNGGLNEVNDAYIGGIDTSYLEPDRNYTFRLTTVSTYGFEDYKFSNVQTRPLPVAVEIDRFDARAAKNGVILDWATVSEVDIQGFNLYRKTTNADKDMPDSDWQLINKELIPVLNPGSSTGETYSYLDEGLGSGQYEYALEIARWNGSTARDWFSTISF